MKIRNINIGPSRWYLMVTATPTESRDFKAWMLEHHPEVFCQYRFNYGDDPYWEVRGADQGVKMYIIMRWGN